MSGVEVSPAQMRRFARAADDVAAGVRGERIGLDVCHLADSSFGVFFGWMRGRFTRTTDSLVDNLEAQALLLDSYAQHLRDTATEFEEIEAAIARIFASREGW